MHLATCKHKPAEVLVQILTRLRDAGLVEAKTVATAGRSAESWFPARQREKREVGEERVSSPDLTSHNSLTSQAGDGFEEVVV